MNTIELFSTMLQGGKEVFLSVEDLLTMFNRNISKNAELLDYIGRKNLFEMIGKTRNEGVHSRFIAELLSGVFFMGQSRESTLIHFLDLLLYRSAKENKASEINAHFKKRILTRSLSVENADSVCELPVKEYQKMYNVNNTINTDKNDRIDIYIRYELTTPIAGRDTLEIFIENKVNSSEFDSQTLRYFEECDNGGFKRPFQLFIYLTPQSLRDMENYYGLDKKDKPTCPHYIHICYQDILNYIIEPLMNDDSLDDDKKAMLKEYVRCLELPAMPDVDSQVPGNDLSIMAISSRERNLVKTFMEDAINRRIINKA
ncbi:MAG: PD-(D/E)XK nuclease family protein, partial [Prevotella sp.]|nr:PD-(D/E)XK nuclease family protein [Prevotella sp.]